MDDKHRNIRRPVAPIMDRFSPDTRTTDTWTPAWTGNDTDPAKFYWFCPHQIERKISGRPHQRQKSLVQRIHSNRSVRSSRSFIQRNGTSLSGRTTEIIRNQSYICSRSLPWRSSSQQRKVISRSGRESDMGSRIRFRSWSCYCHANLVVTWSYCTHIPSGPFVITGFRRLECGKIQ